MDGQRASGLRKHGNLKFYLSKFYLPNDETLALVLWLMYIISMQQNTPLKKSLLVSVPFPLPCLYVLKYKAASQEHFNSLEMT